MAGSNPTQDPASVTPSSEVLLNADEDCTLGGIIAPDELTAIAGTSPLSTTPCVDNSVSTALCTNTDIAPIPIPTADSLTDSHTAPADDEKMPASSIPPLTSHEQPQFPDPGPLLPTPLFDRFANQHLCQQPTITGAEAGAGVATMDISTDAPVADPMAVVLNHAEMQADEVPGFVPVVAAESHSLDVPSDPLHHLCGDSALLPATTSQSHGPTPTQTPTPVPTQVQMPMPMPTTLPMPTPTTLAAPISTPTAAPAPLTAPMSTPTHVAGLKTDPSEPSTLGASGVASISSAYSVAAIPVSTTYPQGVQTPAMGAGCAQIPLTGEDDDSMPFNKRPWSDEEDSRLLHLVEQHGCRDWAVISNGLATRNRKQCRDRYKNHLQNGVKKGSWTQEEDNLIFELQKKYGNKWSTIAEFLPNRTDNAIKNRFWSATRSKERRMRKEAKRKLQHESKQAT